MSLHPSQPALSKKPVEDFSQAVLSLFPGLICPLHPLLSLLGGCVS